MRYFHKYWSNFLNIELTFHNKYIYSTIYFKTLMNGRWKTKLLGKYVYLTSIYWTIYLYILIKMPILVKKKCSLKLKILWKCHSILLGIDPNDSMHDVAPKSCKGLKKCCIHFFLFRKLWTSSWHLEDLPGRKLELLFNGFLQLMNLLSEIMLVSGKGRNSSNSCVGRDCVFKLIVI